MIIERAILQDETGGIVREYHRPDEIRQVVRRMQSWRGSAERCSNCSASAVLVRTGVAFCAVCYRQREERFATVTPPVVVPAKEHRAEPEAVGIVGHFIVFDSRSVDLGGFFEEIRPSAVDRSLSEKHDIRALWSHNAALPLGRSGPRTLKVRKDARGLYGEIATPSWADQYLESVERGDVSGASFGFSVIEDVWHFKREEETILREVLDMVVWEVSPVAFPAYPSTRIRAERLSARMERETAIRLRLAR